jgi:large subunit ribosomal protein L11
MFVVSLANLPKYPWKSIACMRLPFWRKFSSITASESARMNGASHSQQEFTFIPMAKKITKKLKLQIVGGKATPAPPVGPALGQAGINIGDFVTKFNAATAQMMGDVIPVEISVYEDRTFTFILKVSPVSRLILKALGKDKASTKPGIQKAGMLTQAQVEEIAKKKMPDLNAASLEAAMKTVAGTARSMGITVEA